ncbi:MAG: hypothetical protein AB2693_03105, partial [Candidatus Thiodiazotropha sp.]
VVYKTSPPLHSPPPPPQKKNTKNNNKKTTKNLSVLQVDHDVFGSLYAFPLVPFPYCVSEQLKTWQVSADADVCLSFSWLHSIDAISFVHELM